MEFRLDIIEKELLKLKKSELVQFIISRRLPKKLQNITVVIDFLLANESISCCRCSNGQIIPITFYQSEQAVKCSRSLVEADYNGKPIHWNNRESTITEANNIWTAPIKDSTISKFNLNATVPANEYIFKPPISRNESTVSGSRFLSTALTNDVRKVKSECLSAEENLDLDAVVKLEDPDLNEEKFTTSLDQCKPLIEKGQLQNADDKKDTSDTKVEEIFQCELCSYKTRHKSYIIRHGLTHSEEKPFSCFTCGYKAKVKEQLKIHIRTHTGFKKLSCDLCNYKCSTKPILKSHMQSHTREVEFACSLCDYKTFQELLFNKHIKSRHRIASFQCEICGNTFKIKADLKRHILQHHTSDKPFKCDSCDYTCVARTILNKHNRVIHLREKTLSCDFCDYKCFGKSSLTQHRRIHTGEKPFQCNQCDYKSSIKTQLRIHMRTHTGEKPFACEFCGYRAAFKPNVKLHIQRVHSGEMPFSCKLCDFKSKYHRDLKKHIETHINV